MIDKLTHCMCGCIYEEPECPRCNKITDKDRIEELEERLKAAQDDAMEAEAYAAELEAKLAKAVEALGRIADDCEADYPPSHGAIKHDARTTLAELTGGKYE